MFAWLKSLLFRKPVRLAIVRRYCDANGAYVGELYMDTEKLGYAMIGMSLDTLPLDIDCVSPPLGLLPFDDLILDTRNDFLTLPMPSNTVRVGALDPRDNDRVREMVARLPRRRMSLVVQNRFIEHALGKGKA